ncbi:MAG TPA: DUF1843 domain-containing protein [Pyrinomonadaceae bacterium]|jgi:uncharacterized spore protein YtfJ
MPARKGTSKGASKGASKSSGSKKGATKSKAPAGGGGGGGIQPLYGVVIRDTIARGDTAEMKRLATAARKHIKDVESALAKLDAKLK